MRVMIPESSMVMMTMMMLVWLMLVWLMLLWLPRRAGPTRCRTVPAAAFQDFSCDARSDRASSLCSSVYSAAISAGPRFTCRDNTAMARQLHSQMN